MRIRKSHPADQQQIADFIRETIRTINLADYSEDHVLIWSNAISPDMLQARLESVIQYVADVDGEVVGVGDIRVDTKEVDFLYIHKNYIDKGIGTSLVERLEEAARESGLTALSVTSSITAKPFFERKGFVVQNEYFKTMSGKDFKVFLMKKEL
jgi:putative acetyltransferase